jgi:indole-3-glycerol phosphate synthase
MPAAILDEIVLYKKKDVERKKKKVKLGDLEEKIALRKKPLDFSAAIKGSKIRLIAEVKKASPSRGVLCQKFKPVEMAVTYAESGAAAISVLTESKHFMGDLKYLERIREKVNLPLLRKDFIFDEYQVYESASSGADAILLITAILNQKQLEHLIALSHTLGMQCLVEVHNEKELERALLCDAKIIGINNRDLNTFNVNTDTTRRLCNIIPAEKIVVSESGIKKRTDIVKLKKWGVNAVLVGESLVTARDIPVRIKELLP